MVTSFVGSTESSFQTEDCKSFGTPPTGSTVSARRFPTTGIPVSTLLGRLAPSQAIKRTVEPRVAIRTMLTHTSILWFLSLVFTAQVRVKRNRLIHRDSLLFFGIASFAIAFEVNLKINATRGCRAVLRASWKKNSDFFYGQRQEESFWGSLNKLIAKNLYFSKGFMKTSNVLTLLYDQ